jgi:phage shock protein A
VGFQRTRLLPGPFSYCPMASTMFESLRAAFREAIRNFKHELHRDEVPELVDDLVSGMKHEAADAKARLRELEDGIQRARAEAAREAQDVDTCRRRERMALNIGDDETARIAGEFAAKHEQRRQVLEEKAEALQKEILFRRAEVEEMIGKIREAEKSRDGLAASVGRKQARESVRAGDALFDELDRMADQLGGSDRERRSADDLLDELDRELDAKVYDDTLAPPERGSDVDEKLAELKRRMRRE